MTMSRFLATALIALTIIFSGCSTTSSVPNYKVSDLFKSYCYFESGSSWTYTNDSIPSTDKVTISEINEYTRFEPSTDDYRYQAIEISLDDNPLNMTLFELTAGTTQVEAGKMNSLFRMYLKDGSYYLVFSPQYPLGEEISLGETIGRYTNVEILNTMTIYENTYESVYHTRVIMDATSTEYHYYIAKNHGLVRFTVSTPQQEYSYSLKSSSLIQ
jgi:hypothetical protein